jgi:uncharacterized protein
MKNIVVDCNVLISAFIGSDTCFKALDKAFSNYRVCYCEATIKELLETLRRPKFQKTLKSMRVEKTLQALYLTGILFTPKACGIQLPDSGDQIYLDLALAANAEYIITGNKKHFPEKLCEGIKVLTPNEFLKQHDKG